jgi:hypothetical protein
LLCFVHPKVIVLDGLLLLARYFVQYYFLEWVSHLVILATISGFSTDAQLFKDGQSINYI